MIIRNDVTAETYSPIPFSNADYRHRTLHHMRILAELAEVTGDIRDALLKPPWQTRPGAHLEAARGAINILCRERASKGAAGQVTKF
jgi:hypothetical protein